MSIFTYLPITVKAFLANFKATKKSPVIGDFLFMALN